MPFPAKVSPQSRRKKLILCIDDHQPGVRARKLILEAAGYRVLTASSGTIGLRILRRHRVHFVVLDYCMPDMDGEAVPREIRHINPCVPVIMLSGQINLPQEVLSAVDVFLSKGQPPAVFCNIWLRLRKAGCESILS
jgi:CheY-like chemotaxis protein